MYHVDPIRALDDATLAALQVAVQPVATILPPGTAGSWISADCTPLVQPLLHSRFPRGWMQARVVFLFPSQQIVAHVDAPIRGRRYHLPLQVNDGCWVFHRGRWQQLLLGEVYRMDPTERHGAVNWGTEVRQHLIVDVED